MAAVPRPVAVLAELIARCAQLHTEEREDEAPELWRVSAIAAGGEHRRGASQ